MALRFFKWEADLRARIDNGQKVYAGQVRCTTANEGNADPRYDVTLYGCERNGMKAGEYKAFLHRIALNGITQGIARTK